MAQQPATPQFNLDEIRHTLLALGRVGMCSSPSAPVSKLLAVLHLALPIEEGAHLVATNRLLALGPTREEDNAVRRVLSLHPAYRQHLLGMLLGSIRQLADDRALAETVEQLDHLSPEMLPLAKNAPVADAPGSLFAEWDRAVWQAPDAVTLLSKVVEQPGDIAEISHIPVVAVGFDWLAWETPPEHPAPAPFADPEPLKSPLASTRHPFWGALVATLDACTGDYPWQSLMLRGPTVRSRHRMLGPAEGQLAELWRSEFGLYPAPPLIEERMIPGKPLAWLQPALDEMARAGAATLNEGTWRLTDSFRTRLMQDDEHMLAFEAVRRRSFRLAQAAERNVEQYQQAVTP
jgi:hypothetical protein